MRIYALIALFVFAGDVPRVDGQLAVARAFGDKSLKIHLSSEPDVNVEMIDNDVEFIILASDGIWKVDGVLSSPMLLDNATTSNLVPYFLNTITSDVIAGDLQ